MKFLFWFILGQKFSCPDQNSRQLLKCLQSKSMINLVLAVDDMIKFGNFSAVFAPVIEDKNFFSESPMMALRRGNFKKVFS